MLSQIIKLKPFSFWKKKDLDKKIKEIYNIKLIQWLQVIDSLQRLIKSIFILDLICYVNNLDFCSNMLTKFEYLYQHTGFIEWDIIFIQLSNKTASHFKDVAHFANILK